MRQFKYGGLSGHDAANRALGDAYESNKKLSRKRRRDFKEFLRDYRKCSACDGKGMTGVSPMWPCKSCDGRGYSNDSTIQDYWCPDMVRDGCPIKFWEDKGYTLQWVEGDPTGTLFRHKGMKHEVA